MEAKKQVLQALQKGNAFIVNNAVAPGKGFRFSAFNSKKEVTMGEEISFDRFVSFKIISPHPRSMIRIVKNGRVAYTTRRNTLVFKVLKPGVFRVEVCYIPRLGRPTPWIYSNPIYVRD